MDDIQKPFKTEIINYAEHVHEMFEISMRLPPLIRKNEDYNEATWDTSDMPYKEGIIGK